MAHAPPSAILKATAHAPDLLADLTHETHVLRRDGNPLRRHAMTFACLGKIDSVTHAVLHRWRAALAALVETVLADRPAGRSPLVVGLAESGIIPSNLVHGLLRGAGLRAGWICSTRRPASGLAFVERHSHGPDHVLPLPDIRPDEIWFVEDEITTGQTLFHLCPALCRHLGVRRARILAFVDHRTPVQRRRMTQVMAEHGIQHECHALLPHHGADGLPEEPVNPLLTENAAQVRPVTDPTPAADLWRFPGLRPAVGRRGPVLRVRETGLSGTVLVAGEAVDLVPPLAAGHPGLGFRQITLSPWLPDGHAIHSRLDIGARHYLYNPHTLTPPFWLLHDPADESLAAETAAALAGLGHRLHTPPLSDMLAPWSPAS